MLLTSRGVSYHSSHAYNAGTRRSRCLWTFFHLYRCNNIVIFEILDQRQWMDGCSQSSELDQQFHQRYTCPKSIHSPISMHQSTTSKARYSRYNTTSHRHQVLFGAEFRISGVGIWVLVGTHLRQWAWLHQYGQERWLTYMRAYSPRWNLNSVLVRFLWTSRSKFLL